MINPKCDNPKCNEELQEYGAILLSPPRFTQVMKYHLCTKCWDKLLELLYNGSIV